MPSGKTKNARPVSRGTTLPPGVKTGQDAGQTRARRRGGPSSLYPGNSLGGAEACHIEGSASTYPPVSGLFRVHTLLRFSSSAHLGPRCSVHSRELRPNGLCPHQDPLPAPSRPTAQGPAMCVVLTSLEGDSLLREGLTSVEGKTVSLLSSYFLSHLESVCLSLPGPSECPAISGC